MQLKASIARAGAHLSLGQAATQASSFARNIIMARLISPADFGIAATLGITLQIIEMFSNVSGDMLLIQAQDGDQEPLQATAQMLRAGRGVANGLVILVLAGPAARLFGVPQTIWAFRCLALLPVVRGLFHLDMSRLQRHFHFAPSVLTDAGANWCATVITLPLAFWLRNYVAALCALLIQATVATIASHVLAERKYQWLWDRGCWRRIVSFGWPLMVNGILMFAIFEGDRLVIGSAGRLFPRSPYSLSDLGAYSAAFSITMAPTMFIANIGSSLFLPLLSMTQNVRSAFRQRYVACCLAVCLAAGLASIGFITLGAKVLTSLYGQKYAVGGTMIGWLGAMWAVRMVRVSPTLAAIALGDSKNTLIANIARSLALVAMVAAAATGAGLVWIPISGLGGELLALTVGIWRLYVKNGISPVDCAAPFGIAALGTILSTCMVRKLGATWAGTIGSCLVCVVLLVASTTLLFETARAQCSSILSRWRANAPAQL